MLWGRQQLSNSKSLIITILLLKEIHKTLEAF